MGGQCHHVIIGKEIRNGLHTAPVGPPSLRLSARASATMKKEMTIEYTFPELPSSRHFF
jgi:hypothetical protein